MIQIREILWISIMNEIVHRKASNSKITINLNKILATISSFRTKIKKRASNTSLISDYNQIISKRHNHYKLQNNLNPMSLNLIILNKTESILHLTLIGFLMILRDDLKRDIRKWFLYVLSEFIYILHV